jgi:hypothetical protein
MFTLLHVKSIRDTITEIKALKAIPSELIGSAKLNLLHDAKSRLTTLMLTLDWNKVEQIISKHEDAEKKAA